MTDTLINTQSSTTSLRHYVAQCKLIAILRGITPEEAAPVGQVLWETGFRIIEVPLNSPSPLKSIETLRQTLPNALIGAGTVMNTRDVRAVRAVGGQLVVSPHCDTEVIRTAADLGMICLPGVVTPTEAFTALSAGAHGLKFFPADLVLPEAIKAMRAVLPADCMIFPVGGISTNNMPAYLQAGVSGFGIGSSLYKPRQSLDDIRKAALRFVAI